MGRPVIHRSPRARLLTLARLVLVLSGVVMARAWAGVDPEVVRQLCRQGDYAAAISAARAGLAEGGRQDEWTWLLADSLRTVGELGQARAALTNALEAGSRSQRLRWLNHQVALDQGDTNAATRQLFDMAELAQSRGGDRTTAGRVALGRAALALGAEPKQVLTRILEPARQEDPKLVDAYVACGELALEKHDYALAARRFQEGLKQLPKEPDLHFGLARAYETGESALMLASLASALELNSNHVGALLLLADHQLDAENFGEAQDLILRARAVNPRSPEAWAYQAVLAHLQNQPAEEKAARAMALSVRSNNPAVPHLIGRKLSRNYRFAEGAALQRDALAWDPGFLPARAQLAEDLLRLGHEAEGWQLAEEVEKADPYDVAAFNLGTLRRTMAGFVTLSNAHTLVRMTPREAALYGPRALDLLERARTDLGGRYAVSLDRPVLVEIFADSRDFAVRTFGMPENHGFLGVCFGPVITANSPASRPGRSFNWEAMLWHEYTHVLTLQLTANRMPRWLSEGISVHEERRANPAWGEHLIPVYREMLLADDLTPLSKLSGAFMAPPSPLHLQFAYYESSLAVEFLTERYGLENLRAILRDLAGEWNIHQALERHAAPLERLDSDFRAYARGKAEAMAPGLDWERPPRNAAEAELDAWSQSRSTNYYAMVHRARRALAEKRWLPARSELEQLTSLHPEARGGDRPYRMLAEAARGLGDTVAERQALARLIALESDEAEACRRLMELDRAERDWEAAAAHANLHLAINPLVAAPHQVLAEAAEALGQPALAISSYRALLQLDPANPAEVRFRLARQLFRGGDAEARMHLLQALEDAPRHRAALELLLELDAARQATPSTTRLESRPLSFADGHPPGPP